jgi:hypothetical protein
VTRSIPWPRILAEGGAIVVSILLAFGIQAWWERRIAIEAEGQLLGFVETDMARNRVEIQRVLAVHERKLVEFERFMASSATELGAWEADSAQAFVSALSTSTAFTARDGALVTADLSLIRDPALKNAIGAWIGLAGNAANVRPILIADSQKAARRSLDVGWEFRSAGPFSGAPAHLSALRSDRDYVTDRTQLDRNQRLDVRRLTDLGAQTDSILIMLRRQGAAAPVAC